jgi:hypothetical protein
MTGLSILATVQAELDDLDRIERIMRVFGVVDCAPGFGRTPEKASPGRAYCRSGGSQG